MPETWIVILLHQLVFQGMFFIKNILLYRKIKKQIRGKNIEANISIAYFVLFIGASVWMSFHTQPFGRIHMLSEPVSMALGSWLLIVNLAVSGASLVHLKDSWRIGVSEDQRTELVTTGIYRFTRNPFFVSYLLMFSAYTVLLQNAILLGLSIAGSFFIHAMIRKEERYLHAVHGDAYTRYKAKVPRYIII